MHEVAAMRGIVTTVLEEARAAGAERVTHVELALGASGHFTEEAARQHFTVFAKGTLAEGAALSFQWLPATYQCFTCLCEFESAAPAEEVSCPNCGGIALEIAHHDSCYVMSLDVALAPEAAAVVSSDADCEI